MNGGTLTLVDHHQVEKTIAIQVGGVCFADGSVRRPEWAAFTESSASVVQVDVTLATLLVWDRKVERAVTIEAGERDRGCRFRANATQSSSNRPSPRLRHA